MEYKIVKRSLPYSCKILFVNSLYNNLGLKSDIWKYCKIKGDMQIAAL